MVEIISIGDELLIGQVVNTNASWMAEELNAEGYDVRQITCISDSGPEITRALSEASSRADVILLTGGLGPTKDDITKAVLCDFFSTKLIINKKVLENVKSFFIRRGLPVTSVNTEQALVPESATVIENTMGTAPGLAFELNNKLYISMPGVPYEMKHIMESYVLPLLRSRSTGYVIVHRTILTQGIGESFLSEKIADWEDSLAPDIKLAYLPSPGTVRLRLSMRGQDKPRMEQRLEEKVNSLKNLIPKYIWGEGKQSLEEVIGQLLLSATKTVSTAESCTGGSIAQRITSVPGSSGWFTGSVVAYDNKIKMDLLEVEVDSLSTYGAVSQEVVEEMALGAKQLLGTDYAISVSGIAGPDGGTEEKPVGTIWICVAGPGNSVKSRKYIFSNQRQRNVLLATNAALALLREVLTS
jgi:nicotinamide-nucleotide amidase